MFSRNHNRTFLIIALTVLFVLTALGGTYGQATKGIRIGKRQPSKAGSERRVALVIGNGDYKFAPLRNPVNDARAMATTLRSLGFEVISVENGRRRRMALAIRDFGNALKRGGVGLFYYSGHGIEVRGRNYMIPVGAQVASEDEVEFEGVDAARVLRVMERANNEVNIVILDACRNNPFQRSFTSKSQGLARMDAPRGTYISYATAPGKVASDGSGQNGLYTEQLVKHMKTPGIGIEEMFKRVRADVFKKSNKTQVPWTASSLVAKFSFNKAAPVKPPTVAVAPPRPAARPAPRAAVTPRNMNEEEEFWLTVKDSGSSEDLQAYLEVYPKGRFAAIARVKIRQLKRKAKSKTAAAAPKPAPTIKLVRTEPAFVQPPRVSYPHRITSNVELFTKMLGKYRWRTPKGTTGTGEYRENGTAILRFKGRRWEGTWWITQGSVCTNYAKRRRKSKCYRMTEIAPNRFRIHNKGNGKYAGERVNIGDNSQRPAASGVSKRRFLPLLHVTLDGHKHRVQGVAFSPDGKKLATVSLDRTLKIWEVESGILIVSSERIGQRIYSVAYSPDGKRILTGHRDGTLGFWDPETATLNSTLKAHRKLINSVAFSRDGKLAVTASDDETVKVWDVESRTEIQVFKGHDDDVYSAEFTPDGRMIASASDDETVMVWEVDSGRLVKTLKGHTDDVYAVAISPDGKMIASGGADKAVILWDLESGQIIRRLKKHTHYIFSLSFSPDGKFLASSARDFTVRLWEVKTGQEIRVYQGHRKHVYTVAISPDGLRIGSGSADETAKIWNMPDR